MWQPACLFASLKNQVHAQEDGGKKFINLVTLSFAAFKLRVVDEASMTPLITFPY